jgi:hypothetical protein
VAFNGSAGDYTAGALTICRTCFGCFDDRLALFGRHLCQGIQLDTFVRTLSRKKANLLPLQNHGPVVRHGGAPLAGQRGHFLCRIQRQEIVNRERNAFIFRLARFGDGKIDALKFEG